MADTLYSDLSDSRLSEVLAAEIDMLLADRMYLWGHPALMYVGDASGSGSSTIKTPQVGLGGYDEMASAADGAAVSGTVITDASATVAVARYALAREISDLARLTDSTGKINVSGLAADMVASAHAAFTTSIAALGSGFSSSVGTSGSDLSVDNFFSAVLTLELANVATGPNWVAVLHSQQIGDLRASLRSESGVLEHSPATAETVQRTGQQSAGTLLGVDILRSNRVPTANAGADRAGFMFGKSAIYWADAAVPGVPGLPGQIAPGGRISVDIGRDELSAMTNIVGNYFFGTSEGQDGAGVGIITDA